MKLRGFVFAIVSSVICSSVAACGGGGNGDRDVSPDDPGINCDLTFLEAVLPVDDLTGPRDVARDEGFPETTIVDDLFSDTTVVDAGGDHAYEDTAADDAAADVEITDEGVSDASCPASDECRLPGSVDPDSGLCVGLPVENGTPCTWGVCWDGLCIGLRDGELRLSGYWAASDGAVFDPAAAGNGNEGAGLVPAGGAGRLHQTVAVLPKYLRLKAGFDAVGDCGADDPSTCAGRYPRPAMYTGGVMAFRGTVDGPDNWVSKSSCLGEAAYGEDVVYALGVIPAAGTAGNVRFDNAWLRIVDEQTCPAIGTVLNGDIAGQFGWKECRAGSGMVQYVLDAGKPYVSVGRSGTCTDISCMYSIMSTPFASTMAHPALKFDYRSGGSAMGDWDYFLAVDSSGTEKRLQDSAFWTPVTVCIPLSEQGRAGGVWFYRAACFDGTPDWIDISDARIEDAPGECP